MNSIDTLYNIIDDPHLFNYPFKYCLVNEKKVPFTINEEYCKVNNPDDFISIYDVLGCPIITLEKYAGLGISIQASNVCAIDVDKCVDVPFSKDNINNIGSSIIEMFKDFAYIEFSFSGQGLRIFFKTHIDEDYEEKYYIKNSKNHIEFYYPEGSNRYVTITGRSLYSNEIVEANSEQQGTIHKFLQKYMQKSTVINTSINYSQNRTLEDCQHLIKLGYLSNNNFQDLWFSAAPGSGKDESERDYHLIAYLYQNITTNKEQIKELFESSPFFKSKDVKHKRKWTQNNYRYFNYLYDRISNK